MMLRKRDLRGRHASPLDNPSAFYCERAGSISVVTKLRRACITAALVAGLLRSAAPAAAYSVLHVHEPGPSTPQSSLILDGAGNLYGTTTAGGASDRGTVFTMKTDGTGLRVLHGFASGASDGRAPNAALVLDGAGNLYGTTQGGGPSDFGTVFTVRTDGTSFQLLHIFAGGASDGHNPLASLVLDSAGTLFGTTRWGGSSNFGTVFTLKTDGTDFHILHSFAGGASDGSGPCAALLLDDAGNLYGTTHNGGSSSIGTVFTVRTDGTGFQLLHTFTGGADDGRNPYAALVLDSAGNLYGATNTGGPSNLGTVFTVKTDGTGFRLLHTFAGGASDGSWPLAALVLDAAGNLYGTTVWGGPSNLGTVFTVRTDGTGFRLLHGFAGGTTDGSSPYAALVLDPAGNLYGTTRAGGLPDRGMEFTLASLCLAPRRPGDFTESSAAVCQGETGVVYSVPNEPGATYAWTYSGAGATIDGSSANVTVGFSPAATSGTLSVTASNVCGTSPPRTLDVAMDPLPAQPGEFTQCSSTVCQGDADVAYGVPHDPTVSYEWTYSGTGVTIQGTGCGVRLSFSPSATCGTLGVTARNACGASETRSLPVTVLAQENAIPLLDSRALTLLGMLLAASGCLALRRAC